MKASGQSCQGPDQIFGLWPKFQQALLVEEQYPHAPSGGDDNHIGGPSPQAILT